MDSERSKESRWRQWEDLPSDEEGILIERIAQLSIKHKIDLITEMTLESISPIAPLTANLGMNILGPYLEFFGVDKVTALFRKRENLNKLLDRIDELRIERDAKKKEQLKPK